MNTIFTWSIPSNGILTINYPNRLDTVAQVRYTLTATDGVNTESINGVVDIIANDGGTFTLYEDLTQTQVIEWVKSSIREVDLEHYKLRLTMLLDQKTNPPIRPVIKPVPWNTCVQA
jgi:hypothetical protein